MATGEHVDARVASIVHERHFETLDEPGAPAHLVTQRLQVRSPS